MADASGGDLLRDGTEFPGHAGSKRGPPFLQKGTSGLEEVSGVQRTAQIVELGVPQGVIRDRQEQGAVPNAFFTKALRGRGTVKHGSGPGTTLRRHPVAQCLGVGIAQGVVEVGGGPPTRSVGLGKLEVLAPTVQEHRDALDMGPAATGDASPIRQHASGGRGHPLV